MSSLIDLQLPFSKGLSDEEATSFEPALSNAAAKNNEPTVCNIWTCNSSVKSLGRTYPLASSASHIYWFGSHCSKWIVILESAYVHQKRTMGVLTYCVLVRPFVSLIAKREVIKIERKSKIE